MRLIFAVLLMALMAYPCFSGFHENTSAAYSKIPVTVSADDVILSAQQCTGGYIEITAAKTATLAVGTVGMNLVVRSSGANTINVKPTGSEVIVLNGSALTGGNKITSTGAANDSVTMVHNGTNWIVIGSSTWTDGGA